MKIESITSSQYPIFHSLMTGYYRDGEDADTPQEELDAFIELLFHLCQDNVISGAVAYADGPVGFILWGVDTTDFPFSNMPGFGTILEIGIIPAMRCAGFGAQLVSHAEKAMACAGYYVCAYGPAENFWRKCGYRKTEQLATNGLNIFVKP